MWRKKTDKRITATGIAMAALLIGYGAWRDVHPEPVVAVQGSEFPTYIWATTNDATKLIKADNTLGGIYWMGDIVGDPPSLSPSPITPATLPQQEAMPMFALTEIPHALSPLFDIIKPGVFAWTHTGSIVNDIYIDYRTRTPDYEALTALVSGLRAYMDRQYWVDIGLMRTSDDLPPETRTKLANMLKNVETFSYALSDVQRGGETLEQTIARLEDENLPFLLRVTEKPDYTALRASMPQGRKNFSGFIIDKTNASQEEAPQ